jgi:hypothetical protein
VADFELHKKSLKVKIYGEEFSLRKPSVSQVENLLDKQKSDEFAGKDIKLMRSFMVDLGLPEKLSLEMDADDFNALVLHVMNATKKKSIENGSNTQS